MIKVTRTQAVQLLMLFDGAEAEMCVEYCEQAHSGPGLYVHDSEYPECAVRLTGLELDQLQGSVDAAVAGKRPSCQRCGCTAEHACGVRVSSESIVACCWVRPGLCSACATVGELFKSSDGLAWLVTCLCECFGESLADIVSAAQGVAEAAAVYDELESSSPAG